MMSYYLLPKKNNIIKLNPKTLPTNIEHANIEHTNCEKNKIELNPCISYSLAYYLNDTLDSLNSLSIQSEEINNIKKKLNAYEYLFSKVPDVNIQVSKIIPKSYIFFIMIEILNVFNIFEYFSNKVVKLISYSKNSECVFHSLNVYKDCNSKYKDVVIEQNVVNEIIVNEIIVNTNKSLCKLESIQKEAASYDFDASFCPSSFDYKFEESKDSKDSKESKESKESKDSKYRENKNLELDSLNFLFYEIDAYTNIETYSRSLMKILYDILINQKENGLSIIKIDHIFYKPVIDFLFLLTSLYEKVHIIKPNSSDATTSERFLFCKNFTASQEMSSYYSFCLKKCILQDKYLICSLVDDDVIPCYFLNKIEDSNITIIHQQIEILDQIIGIAKNKNREEKLSMLKKNNIQKCILWCEKNKIPYNKFFEKSNIFL
jgi:hypothetical protein